MKKRNLFFMILLSLSVVLMSCGGGAGDGDDAKKLNIGDEFVAVGDSFGGYDFLFKDIKISDVEGYDANKKYISFAVTVTNKDDETVDISASSNRLNAVVTNTNYVSGCDWQEAQSGILVSKNYDAGKIGCYVKYNSGSDRLSIQIKDGNNIKTAKKIVFDEIDFVEELPEVVELGPLTWDNEPIDWVRDM